MITEYDCLSFLQFRLDGDLSAAIERASLFFDSLGGYDSIDEFVGHAIEENWLHEDRMTGRSLAAAVYFGKETRFVDDAFDAPLEDLYVIYRTCRRASEQGRPVAIEDVPVEFERTDDVDPDSPRSRYEYTIEREYPDGSVIAFEYNSRDLDSPFVTKPDTSHARLDVDCRDRSYHMWTHWEETADVA